MYTKVKINFGQNGKQNRTEIKGCTCIFFPQSKVSGVLTQAPTQALFPRSFPCRFANRFAPTGLLGCAWTAARRNMRPKDRAEKCIMDIDSGRTVDGSQVAN